MINIGDKTEGDYLCLLNVPWPSVLGWGWGGGDDEGISVWAIFLNRTEIFYTLREAQVLIEKWRLEYNTFRPHSSLNYRPPAPEAYLH
jgi:transposase InsO family protein